MLKQIKTLATTLLLATVASGCADQLPGANENGKEGQISFAVTRPEAGGANTRGDWGYNPTHDGKTMPYQWNATTGTEATGIIHYKAAGASGSYFFGQGGGTGTGGSSTALVNGPITVTDGQATANVTTTDLTQGWTPADDYLMALYPAKDANDAMRTFTSDAATTSVKISCTASASFTQKGKNSAHLSPYIYMYGAVKGKTDNLSPTTDLQLRHATALMRFLVINKRGTERTITGVKITALKAGTQTQKSIFTTTSALLFYAPQSASSPDGNSTPGAAIPIGSGSDATIVPVGLLSGGSAPTIDVNLDATTEANWNKLAASTTKTDGGVTTDVEAENNAGRLAAYALTLPNYTTTADNADHAGDLTDVSLKFEVTEQLGTGAAATTVTYTYTLPGSQIKTRRNATTGQVTVVPDPANASTDAGTPLFAPGYYYNFNLELTRNTLSVTLDVPTQKPDWGTGETPVVDWTKHLTWEGTADAPAYKVHTALGLKALQQFMNDATDDASTTDSKGIEAPGTDATPIYVTKDNRLDTKITLTADIDLNLLEADPTKSNWTPIGDGGYSYYGTLDGGGHTLKNLRIVNSSASGQGLIYNLRGTVKNLTLTDVCISSTGDNVGAVAGSSNGGTIENCHVTSGSVSAGYYVGGIVGKNYSGGSVTKCSNAATVASTGNFAGGIAGYNSEKAIVMACSNTGSVSATGQAGGIVGSNSGGNSGGFAAIVACSNTGSVSATGSEAGGIAGYNNKDGNSTACLYACWSTGSVTGGSNSGGILGSFVNGTLGGCFTTQSTIAVTTGGGVSVDATNGIVPTGGWNGTANNGINILFSMNNAIGTYNTLSQVADDATKKCNYSYIANPDDATQPPVLNLPSIIGYEIDSNGQWLIYNAKGLVAFRNQVNQGGAANLALKAQLMADITMPAGDAAWTEGISKDDTYGYTGTFDGKGCTIYGLKVEVSTSGSTSYAGLFGCINGGTVKNLTLSGVSISANSNFASNSGAVAGWLANGRIENCSVAAAGSGTNSCAGGIVGSTSGGVVMGCSNTGCNVTASTSNSQGYAEAGGIAGYNGGYVTACSNTATATATNGKVKNYAGGIVGENSKIITACWSTGEPTATGNNNMTYAGGIVGENNGSNSTVATSYTTKAIGNATGDIGELVGDITATEWGAMNTALATWSATIDGNAVTCPYRFDTANGAITKPATP